MKNKQSGHKTNIIDLEKRRTLKKPNIIQTLQDSKNVTKAITTSTCMICHTKKACVDKTGICASCYDNVLTAEERMIANEEAKHKIIKILVTDDRWES
jgi:hypothetical protein